MPPPHARPKLKPKPVASVPLPIPKPLVLAPLPKPKPLVLAPLPDIKQQLVHPAQLKHPIQRANTAANLAVSRSGDVETHALISPEHAFHVHLPAVNSLLRRQQLARLRVQSIPANSTGFTSLSTETLGMNQQKEVSMKLTTDGGTLTFDLHQTRGVYGISFRLDKLYCDSRMWVALKVGAQLTHCIHPTLPKEGCAVVAVCVLSDTPILSATFYPPFDVRVADLSIWTR